MGEIVMGELGPRPAPRDAIVLAVSRQGGFTIAGDFAELVPGDRALIITLVAASKKEEDALAAAAENSSA